MTESIVKPSRRAAWLAAMRLPFTTVALVPFAVGIWLAYKSQQTVSLSMSLLGLLAVFLITVGCYLLGEVFDQKEDQATLQYGRSKFAGGSLMVVNGMLSSRAVLIVVSVAFGLAGLLGLVIMFFHSALWLLGLGALGAFSAVAYSLPPLRLVQRGLGEVLIAVCYGWLTLVTGYACATGQFPAYAYLFSLPVAFSIFNVIFINEFPDYAADHVGLKHNLLQRVHKPGGARIYSLVALLTIVALVGIWLFFRPKAFQYLIFLLPAGVLASSLAIQVGWLGKWQDRKTLESLCGQTILLNHLCSLTVGILVIWP